jgi:hypothetical protein
MTSRRDDDPPPDLAEFVRQHGNWRRMPAEQWATYTPEQQDLMRPGAAEEIIRIWTEYGREAADEAIDEIRNQFGQETANALLFDVLQIVDDAEPKP